VRTNKSSFVAANETLTTKCYFSVMDNDMESLSLHYQYHRRERGEIKYKTANILFLPSFSLVAPWAITLSRVNWGGDYEK
jgi:hypothetical protein